MVAETDSGVRSQCSRCRKNTTNNPTRPPRRRRGHLNRRGRGHCQCEVVICPASSAVRAPRPCPHRWLAGICLQTGHVRALPVIVKILRPGRVGSGGIDDPSRCLPRSVAVQVVIDGPGAAVDVVRSPVRYGALQEVRAIILRKCRAQPADDELGRGSTAGTTVGAICASAALGKLGARASIVALAIRSVFAALLTGVQLPACSGNNTGVPIMRCTYGR
eukprot:2165573-Prymnesium_polylepis.2